MLEKNKQLDVLTIEHLWSNLVEAEKAYITARMALFQQNRADFVSFVKAKCKIDVVTVLSVIDFFNTEERKELFAELVYLASFAHGMIDKVREIILSLPREWIITNIESAAEPILANGGYDEYRRLLELYSYVDSHLTQRLAKRAANSVDKDIREAGEDFLNSFSK